MATIIIGMPTAKPPVRKNISADDRLCRKKDAANGGNKAVFGSDGEIFGRHRQPNTAKSD